MRQFTTQFLNSLEKNGGIRFWIYLVAAFLGLCGFITVSDEVIEFGKGEVDEIHLLDAEIIKFVAELRTPFFTQIMTDITAMGSFSVITIGTIVSWALLHAVKNHRGIRHLLIAIAGAAILPSLLKIFFDRPRPDATEALVNTTDASFPSGHTFGATTVYLTLALIISFHHPQFKKVILFLSLASLIVVLVGFSRIYLGVHYPTDVLGGFFAGGAWSFLLGALFNYKSQRTQSH